MLNVATALGLIVGLFVAILALVLTGRRLGLNRKADGLAAVEGAVFGLMGLLIAFTFGSAAVRFETRRGLIVEEAAQPRLRDAFRRYVDTRIAVYRSLPDIAAAKADLALMADLQKEIWEGSVAACRASGAQACTMLLLPAENAMIDITTTRTVAAQTHQPGVIFVMLALLMLACSLLAGFGMGVGSARSWLHVVCFAAVLTIAFYVILDLEYPRVGVIRIDWMDQILKDVRSSMG
jgi:hypothetical protein